MEIDPSRKRFLIAQALFEFIRNDAGKPFEHQSGSNVEEMRHILHTEYADIINVLEAGKSTRHRNLVQTIAAVKKDIDPTG
jgi:hypothetical protein